MIFYENVWKSGELSTGWGLEVRLREAVLAYQITALS